MDRLEILPLLAQTLYDIDGVREFPMVLVVVLLSPNSLVPLGNSEYLLVTGIRIM